MPEDTPASVLRSTAPWLDGYLAGIRAGDVNAIAVALDAAAAVGGAWPDPPALQPMLNSLPRPEAQRMLLRLGEQWPKETARLLAHYASAPVQGLERAASNRLQHVFRTAAREGTQAAMSLIDGEADSSLHVRAGPNQIRDLVAAIPPPEAQQRQLVLDDGSEVVQAISSRLDRVAVVFTGLADQAMFDLPVLDAFLAAAGFNAVYLRDFGRSLYLNGVASFGEGRAATRQGLRALLGNHASALAIGCSAGGFGALHWACELGLPKALCFAAPVCLHPESLDALGERRARALVMRLAQTFPHADLNVRERLERCAGIAVQLHYGELMPADRSQAELLADLSNVRLVPLSGYAGHDVLFPIAWSGQLSQVLESMKSE